jgi:multiple sugar transport system ATP-binding protein
MSIVNAAGRRMVHPDSLSIELVQVTKTYGDATAVSAVDLTFEAGEFVALLGPSGCGKSTLLKLISGLEPLTDGEIYLNGQLANYVRPKRRNVAMVFQNYALYPHMTVRTNIGFALSVAHEPKAAVADKVRAVAELVDLTEHLGKYPDQLSGGQRQRVALGRAIIREPGAFLMDEPLSNLDALLRVQMRTELLKLHRKIGRTTVYVTHDQTEAMTMADRIVVMRAGVVQQVGSPDDVYLHPVNTFVATFVGAPQMNLLPGAWSQADGQVRLDGQASWTMELPGAAGLVDGPLTVGMRPEDFVLCGPGDDRVLSGVVELVETVGPDCYLNIALSSERSITVRVTTDDRLPAGSPIHLRVRPERVRLFDSGGQAVPVTLPARS